MVLFTTALTGERKEQFKWAGPITLFRAGFVSLEGSSILVSNSDDAKKLDSVGVMAGYSTAEMLENAGFQNLTYYNTINDALKDLYENKIDVVFEVHSLLQTAAQDLSYEGSKLKT